VTDKERYQLCQLIVSKFVASTEKINWGREFKYAKILVDKFPELKFWQNFHVTTKPKSLNFFLKGQGLKLLIQSRQMTGLEIEKPESYVLESQKIGEDFVIEKTPKTVIDFIKYGKKIRQN
jgi:hypothetical protein